MKNVDCIGCHQLGQESTRTIPAAFGKFKSGEEAWMRRIQSGQAGEQMTNQLAGQFRRRRRSNISAIGPTASPRANCPRQAAAAARRRAQYRDHVVGVVDAGQISARSDFVGPAQSDGQCLRPAVRLAGILDRQHADPRSEDEQGVVLQDAGARSRDAGIARSRACRQHQAAAALGLLGRREALGHAGQQPQFHVRQEGPDLARGDGARA